MTVLCGLFLFASCGQSLQTHLERGEESLQNRKFEDAEMQFRAATQIDDSSAEAHWGLARVLEAQGKFLETVEELRKVSDLAPEKRNSAITTFCSIHRKFKSQKKSYKIYSNAIRILSKGTFCRRVSIRFRVKPKMRS
jgi:thioredoxin-like negative regulator of GroEL